MSVRRRTFPEVLDSLLTSLVGGVASEEHPFPPPGTDSAPFAHRFEHPPAADIVSVYGSRNGDTNEFRKGVDYRLSADGTSLEWTADAQLPDAGTVFSVSYASATARTALDDLNTGSVVRTIAESSALEIARLYAQLDAVYKAGFVDTATGDSLDHVVGLLGVERVRGGRATGEIEFSRVAGGRGEITIPAGTRVMTADGKVEYATTADVTLADRQDVVRMTARDVESDNDPVGVGALIVLPVPIGGIASVTNPAPTTRAALDETDDELRRRAKTFLGGSERATLGALKGAIARQQITADIEESPTTPGLITVTPHVDALPPELEQRLLAAIEQARPAGVRVNLVAPQPPQKLDLELRLTTAANLLENDLLAAHEAVRNGIADYFERLPTKDPASVNKLVGIALAVAGVEDLRIVSAKVGATDVLDLANAQLAIGGAATVLGDLRIADPALPTLVSATITPNPGPPPNADTIRAALTAVLNAATAANASEGATVSVPYADLRAAAGTVAAATFAFTVRSGFTQILAAAADPPYALVPLERLSLNAVSVDG